MKNSLISTGIWSESHTIHIQRMIYFTAKICRHLFSMIEKMPIAYKEAIVLDKEQCKEVVK